MTITNPVWTLGDRLAKAREHAGLTQEEMAERMGVSHSSIAKYENDAAQPRRFLTRMEQWAAICGVELNWLLGIDNGWAARDSNPEPAEYMPSLPFAA
jgi:transcriptional regulator with XRE-family HTH domain